MFILFILTGLLIVGLKRTGLVPIILFCQASAITIVCSRLGLAAPLIVLAFTVKALIIPSLLYYIVRRTIVFDDNWSAIPVSVVIALVLAMIVAGYLLARRLDAGDGHATARPGGRCPQRRQDAPQQTAHFRGLDAGDGPIRIGHVR